MKRPKGQPRLNALLCKVCGRRFISNKRRADMCPACAKAAARDATNRV